MNKVKMYKVLNISAAVGLVTRVGNKIIIKPNEAYRKVSLAPSWGATVMWASTLSELAEFKIPEKEKFIFIAEVELDASAIVEGCPDALHLDRAEFKKMSADRAVELTYKDWTYGPYNDFYGVRPEVRVDGPVEVKKLYKIKKRAVLNVAGQAPMIDHELEEMDIEFYMELSDEEYNEIIEEKEKDLEKWISEFHKKIDNLKKGLIPSSYEEMMGNLYTDIEINRDGIDDEIPLSSIAYKKADRLLAAIISVQNGAKLESFGTAPFLNHVLHNSVVVQQLASGEKWEGRTIVMLKYASELPDALELLRKYKSPLRVLEELEKLL